MTEAGTGKFEKIFEIVLCFIVLFKLDSKNFANFHKVEDINI